MAESNSSKRKWTAEEDQQFQFDEVTDDENII